MGSVNLVYHDREAQDQDTVLRSRQKKNHVRVIWLVPSHRPTTLGILSLEDVWNEAEDQGHQVRERTYKTLLPLCYYLDFDHSVYCSWYSTEGAKTDQLRYCSSSTNNRKYGSPNLLLNLHSNNAWFAKSKSIAGDGGLIASTVSCLIRYYGCRVWWLPIVLWPLFAGQVGLQQ